MVEDKGKIALLTLYSSETVGGVERFNDQLQTALDNVVLFSEPRHDTQRPRWNLDRVGMRQAYTAHRVVRSFLARHQRDPFSLAISTGITGWPLSIRRLDIPTVQVYHFTLAGFARQALRHRGDRLTTGRISAFFDGLAGRGKEVIAVSPNVLQEVKRFYGLDGRVILNPVDLTLFRNMDKSHAREILGLAEEATIGLYVGRAEYAKGFDILVDVARLMPEVLFTLVASYPDTEPNIRAFDNVPHEKMPLFYAAADFFFLPSRYEGLNLSILEALACDLPIVVSRAAYHLEEDPAVYGYAARTFDPREFVTGIREVLDRAPSFDGRRAIVSSYSLENFGRNWRRLVRSLKDGSG